MRLLGLHTEHTKSVENVTPILVHNVGLKRQKNTWSRFHYSAFISTQSPPDLHIFIQTVTLSYSGSFI